MWRSLKKRRSANNQNNYILETLDLARSQFELFSIKLQEKGANRAGLSALLHTIDKAGLHMEIGDYVPEDWNLHAVDVYFKVRRDGMPVFYAFYSEVLKLKSDYESSSIIIALPKNLRVEKKRHFIRVQPHKNDVRVIGIWPLLPGKKLPQTEDDIGEPIKHNQAESSGEQVRVENVSGAGIALKVFPDKNGEYPFTFTKGSQLLCLLIYSLPGAESRKLAFWSTGEIMNLRKEQGKNECQVLGLEFTNWAILEPDSTGEIHWAHSSPSRGIKPILQWVEQIEKENASEKTS